MGAGNRIMQPPEGGLIAFFGLSDWWECSFSPGERDRICETCDPAGETSLTKGRIWESSGTVVQMLNGLAGHFITREDHDIALRLLQKANELSAEDGAVVDHHYTLEHLINLQAKAEDDPLRGGKALQTAACECQIQLAPKFGSELVREGAVRLPRHIGYETLVALREEADRFEDAISLSRQAREEGWSGDWDRITKKMKRRLTRRQSPPTIMDGDLPAPGARLSVMLNDRAAAAAPSSGTQPATHPAAKLLFRPHFDRATDDDSFGAAIGRERDRAIEMLDRELGIARNDIRSLRSERDRVQARLRDAETLVQSHAEAQRQAERRTEGHEARAREVEEKNVALREKLESSGATLATLNQRRREAEEEILRAGAGRDDLLEETTHLKQQLQERTIRADKLDEEVTSLRTKLSEGQGEIDSLASALQEREDELAGFRTDLEDVESRQRHEVDTRDSIVTQLRNELTELRVTRDEERAENEASRASLSEKLEQLRMEHLDTEDAHRRLRGELEELHRERDLLATKSDELSRIESELRTDLRLHDGQLDAATRKLHELSGEQEQREADLRGSIDERNTARAELARVSLALDETETKSSYATSRVSELERELDEVHARAAQQLAENSALHGDFDELHKQLGDRERLAKEVSRLGVEREAMIESLVEDIADLRDDYNNSTRKREDLEAKLADITKNRDELNEALDTANTDAAEQSLVLNDQIVDLQARLESAEESVQASATRATELTTELGGLRDAEQPLPPQATPIAPEDGGAISDIRTELQQLRVDMAAAIQSRDSILQQMRGVQATAVRQAQISAPESPAAPPHPAFPATADNSILNPDWEYDPYTRPQENQASHIAYECPHCHRSLRIPRQFAGWFGQCKLCNGDITVPKA